MKKNTKIIILAIILILPMTVKLAIAKDQCGDGYLGRKNTDKNKLCLYTKNNEFPCECPENEDPVCNIEYIENEDTFQEKIICAKSEDIKFQMRKIPYIFETGIPLIAKKGEQLEAMSLSDLVARIIQAAFSISGILAFVMIIVGGIQYMISGGDTKKQKSAQETITNAVIGLILLFGFWLILYTINPDILRRPEIGISPPTSISPQPSNLAEEVIAKSRQLGVSFFYNSFVNKAMKTNINWTEQDLIDTRDGKLISPAETAGHFDSCTSNVDNTVKNFPETTIDSKLLEAISRIYDKFENWQSNPGCQLSQIGPFIRAHYYCTSNYFCHEKGKAVDLTLVPKSNSTVSVTTCLGKFSEYLCNMGNAGDWCSPKNMKDAQLKNLGLNIYNEYGSYATLADEPHLHLQVANRQCK
ncbi:MAG TPA: pilin [Candidatus Paceibacterota bacterium]|nr:pilin [Candidatus Paceibacterota bacterium]